MLWRKRKQFRGIGRAVGGAILEAVLREGFLEKAALGTNPQEVNE